MNVTRQNTDPNSLTIALSKGRILDATLPLLAAAGIHPQESIEHSRKLIIATHDAHIRLLILRATDVPVYVEYGAADVGIAGKDVLMENPSDALYEPLDLKIAQCRLMTAVPVEPPPRMGRMRVATKFANIARSWYAQQGQQVDVIKLYGSMELAPLVGLADAIVDVVDTGKTLAANGLKPQHLIAHISSRLIVNQAAMKHKYRCIRPFLEKLDTVLQQRSTPNNTPTTG